VPYRPKFIGKLKPARLLGLGFKALQEAAIPAFTREFAAKGHGELTRMRLVNRYPGISKLQLDQLELRGEISRGIAQSLNANVRRNPFAPPVLYELDEPRAYIASQGGRVNVQVEVTVFDPDTGEGFPIHHDFILTESPSRDLLDQMVESLMMRLCESPKFAEQYCPDLLPDYDYEVIGMDGPQ
jgi:hypothetical protein